MKEKKKIKKITLVTAEGVRVIEVDAHSGGFITEIKEDTYPISSDSEIKVFIAYSGETLKTVISASCPMTIDY